MLDGIATRAKFRRAGVVALKGSTRPKAGFTRRRGLSGDRPEIAAIDQLYWGVRVALNYGAWILGAAALLVVALVWWIAGRLLRRPKAAS